MDETTPADSTSDSSHPPAPAASRGLLSLWHHTPLYLRIIVALILGVITGVVMGQGAADLAIPSKLVLRVLGALAPALILVAIIHALMTANVRGATTLKLFGLLVMNTVTAILIGLVVANIMKPGEGAQITPEASAAQGSEAPQGILTQFLDNVPKSVLGPLTDEGKVLGVIFLALALGMALRKEKDREIRTVQDFIELAMRALVTILHWVIEVVPLAIFGIVASIIGTKGFAAFHALGHFVVAVLIALFCQATYYLLRIRFGSWVRPLNLLRGTRDALVMAFSTSSSTATMPVTYDRLRKNVGLREESASMGALVGSNFNNDGTALYEAMSALFIAQMIGQHLNLIQQLMVVLTSIIASVGAAGIPEAGLITMTLVFHAVGLPTEYIAILLTVDWFLDRSRTVINVMGDMNVSCLLDGKVREARAVALVEE